MSAAFFANGLTETMVGAGLVPARLSSRALPGEKEGGQGQAVRYHDILYTLVSGHPLHFCGSAEAASAIRV
jgi:hypothetical protein